MQSLLEAGAFLFSGILLTVKGLSNDAEKWKQNIYFSEEMTNTRLYVCLLIYIKYKNSIFVYMVACITNVCFTDNLSLLQPLEHASKSVAPCLLTVAFVFGI